MNWSDTSELLLSITSLLSYFSDSPHLHTLPQWYLLAMSPVEHIQDSESRQMTDTVCWVSWIVTSRSSKTSFFGYFVSVVFGCVHFVKTTFAVHKFLKQFATPLNTWTRSCITSDIYIYTHTRAIIYINTHAVAYATQMFGLKKDKKKRLIKI